MKTRYVMKSEAGMGWRIWNRKTNRWWGNWFPVPPIDLVSELNREKRPAIIVDLTQRYLKH